jgi:hypothetical protein
MLTHSGKTAAGILSQPAGFETKSNKKRNDAWPAMLGVYFFTVKTMEHKLREMATDGRFAEMEKQLLCGH